MKKMLFLVPLLFSVAFLHAQIAEDMDLLLNTKEVTYSLAARFILSAAGILPEDAREVEAFREAQGRGWIKDGMEPSTLIRMDGLSLLCMKAFSLKGGLMYTIFPVRRYAYREMLYKQFIQGRKDPAMTLSGERFILVLGRILSYTGDEA